MSVYIYMYVYIHIYLYNPKVTLLSVFCYTTYYFRMYQIALMCCQMCIQIHSYSVWVYRFYMALPESHRCFLIENDGFTGSKIGIVLIYLYLLSEDRAPTSLIWIHSTRELFRSGRLHEIDKLLDVEKAHRKRSRRNPDDRYYVYHLR